MLNRIVSFSLRFRGIVIALGVALLVYGSYSLTRAKYDVFPNFAPPEVGIQTEAPGLCPEQVETLVTQPIENVINGVTGIESLRSTSIQGLSVITVIFQPGTEVYRDRQAAAERLANLAGHLPEGVKSPVMTPLVSPTGDVLVIGLMSEEKSLMDVRTVADWVVRPRLLAVPGVAKVTTFGGQVKQFQVQFQTKNLIQYNLAIEDVLAAAQRATGIFGAGFIDTPNQRLVLHSDGQSLTAAQLAQTVVVHQGASNVLLSQIARVTEGPEPPIGAASIRGKPGVILVTSAQYGANTLQVTRAVQNAIEEMRGTLLQEGIVLDDTLFRPANFIQASIHNIRSSLIVGAVLVIIVIFLFLFNLRTAAISCTAIPLSLLTAVIVMERMGLSLNTMTLGGLAIAIGEVVDDAVIDVENIFRRLRENRRSSNPSPAIQVVLKASIEMRSAVVYATFAVVLIFLPILTVSGVAGRIFAPLAVAYVLSVLASLLVALTVTPALCLMFLASGRVEEAEPPVAEWLRQRYRSVLLGVEKAPRTVIAVVALLTMAGVAVVPLFRSSFLPELREGHFILHMSAVPGTSLEESLRIGAQVSSELMKTRYVRSVSQRAGRAEISEDTWGTHYSELDVDLKPGLDGEANESAEQEIYRALAHVPGVTSSLKTFLSERIEESVSGYTAAIAVRVYGADLDALDRAAADLASVLGGVPGAREVQVQSPPGTPQVEVQLRPSELIRWGFEPVTVLQALHTAFQGETVGQVFQGNRVFDVTVILDSQERTSMADLRNLPVRSPSGNYVHLSQLGSIYGTAGRYSVLHSGARRVQTVTLNASGRDLNSFLEEARKQIAAKVKLPTGMYVEFAGTAAAQAQSRRDLFFYSLLSALGIIALLSVVMMNTRNLLLVLANLPFALLGGVIVVLATGATLSLGSLVGFITLFGITLRNSIMLISHYEHLTSEEGMSWGLEAAIRGASERVTPILMTALVTGLGLLPLALGSGDPGREIEGPMATVILGGLVTSTLLNLLVLPTLALRYGRFEPVGAQPA